MALSNKRYALAGKFFEYIFEPVLAQKNRLFYERDFHKFVAMAVYLPFGRGPRCRSARVREFSKPRK